MNAAFASSRNEIRKIATAFLAGESLPLESALTVRALITDDCPLEEAWQIVTGVVSETDDILLDDSFGAPTFEMLSPTSIIVLRSGRVR